MNREKAEIILSAIKADLERHDQSIWTNITATPESVYADGSIYPGFGIPKVKESEGQVINCGTTACLAGHTGFIFAPVGTKFYKESLRIPGKSLISYEDYADEELELTQGEVNYLFSAYRSIEEIETYITATDAEQETLLETMYEEE
jgi:hypothetical protein